MLTGNPLDGNDIGILVLQRPVTSPAVTVKVNQEPQDNLNLPTSNVPAGQILQLLGYGVQVSASLLAILQQCNNPCVDFDRDTEQMAFQIKYIHLSEFNLDYCQILPSIL